MDIGAAIRHTRESLGLKLEALAMEAGTDAGNLSRIERGKQQPTLEKLRNIAAAMDITLVDLFKMSEVPVSLSDSDHALRDRDEIAYEDDLQGLKRGFAALDERNRKVVLEFIKMLNRVQREDE